MRDVLEDLMLSHQMRKQIDTTFEIHMPIFCVSTDKYTVEVFERFVSIHPFQVASENSVEFATRLKNWETMSFNGQCIDTSIPSRDIILKWICSVSKSCLDTEANR